MSSLMPALFIGHGSPMNAIEPTPFTAAWRRLGLQLPTPRAVLCISAHWYTRGTGVTAMAQPRTIHDFYGFPPELYQCQYAAPGDTALAARVQQLLQPTPVLADQDWGFDHGAWSVLLHLLPAARVPVVQLSIDAELSAAQHYALARRLAPLRAEGVLILGSGNVVHNLRRMQRSPDAAAFDWATSFNTTVRDAVLSRDHAALTDLSRYGAAAQHSVPTPEHYLPLLYVLAQQDDADSATIPVDGIDMGAISMLSVLIAGAQSAPQKQ
jgi:4,5-DOPA dioxygenase extradiol